MTPNWLRVAARSGLVFVLLLAKCSSGTGPGLDDPLQFIARVDGALWQPTDSARTLAFLVSDSLLVVGGIRFDRNDRTGVPLDGIGVQVSQFTGPGVYSLADDPFSSYGEYVIYSRDGAIGRTFRTTAPGSGRIHVTEVDTMRHLIAGVFSFQAQDLNGSAGVAISQGRFRLTYEPRP